jgi:hypothetical protein
MATPAVAQEPSATRNLSLLVRSTAAALVPTIAAPAAQGVSALAPASRKLTVVTGADVPVLGGYVLRGFIQEFNPKFTIQP